MKKKIYLIIVLAILLLGWGCSCLEQKAETVEKFSVAVMEKKIRSIIKTAGKTFKITKPENRDRQWISEIVIIGGEQNIYNGFAVYPPFDRRLQYSSSE